jgi:hypothetical protein
MNALAMFRIGVKFVQASKKVKLRYAPNSSPPTTCKGAKHVAIGLLSSKNSGPFEEPPAS